MSLKKFYFDSYKDLFQDFSEEHQELLKFMYSFRESSNLFAKELLPLIRANTILNSEEVEEKLIQFTEMHSKDIVQLQKVVKLSLSTMEKTIKRNDDPTNQELP